MGWTYVHKPSHQKASDFLREHFSGEGEKTTFKVLDVAIKNLRTAYMAVEVVEKTSGNREVFAMVCLLHYTKGFNNFGYKDMEESMGPYERECPERILKLLTPTDNQHAQEWRKDCWEHIRQSRKKFREGDVLKFGNPITFRDGKTLTWAVVDKADRWNVWFWPVYRVSKRALSSYGTETLELPKIGMEEIRPMNNATFAVVRYKRVIVVGSDGIPAFEVDVDLPFDGPERKQVLSEIQGRLDGDPIYERKSEFRIPANAGMFGRNGGFNRSQAEPGANVSRGSGQSLQLQLFGG